MTWGDELQRKRKKKCANVRMMEMKTQRRFVFEMNNKGYHRNEINISVHARAQQLWNAKRSDGEKELNYLTTQHVFVNMEKKKDFLSQKQSNVQLRKRIMRIIKLHQWLWIYENRIFVLRLINVYESDLRRNEHYPSSIENKVWKKFRPLRDMNLWPVRDMNLWPVRYQTLIHRFTGLLLTNIMANSQLAC